MFKGGWLTISFSLTITFIIYTAAAPLEASDEEDLFAEQVLLGEAEGHIATSKEKQVRVQEKQGSYMLFPFLKGKKPNETKRTYVGLDFPDYVTDEEGGNTRRNGNSIGSSEGGKRRYWRKG